MNDQHGGARQQGERQQFSGQRNKGYSDTEGNQRDYWESRRSDQNSDSGPQGRGGGYGGTSGSESYQGQGESTRTSRNESQGYGPRTDRGYDHGGSGSAYEQDASRRASGSQYSSAPWGGSGSGYGEYNSGRNRSSGGGGSGEGNYRAMQPGGQTGYGIGPNQSGPRADREGSPAPGAYGYEGSSGGYPDSGASYGAGNDRAGWSGQQSNYGGGRRSASGSGSAGYGSSDGSSGGYGTMRSSGGQIGSMDAYESTFGSGSSRRRGTAPRSYKRSDERVNEDVCERLVEAGIDCGGVDVAVKDGVVTLSGEVQHRADKHRIEQIAAESSGVQDVENQLRLKKSYGSDQSSKSLRDAGSYSTSDANADRSSGSSSQSTSAATGISGAVAKAGDTATGKKY